MFNIWEVVPYDGIRRAMASTKRIFRFLRTYFDYGFMVVLPHYISFHISEFTNMQFSPSSAALNRLQGPHSRVRIRLLFGGLFSFLIRISRCLFKKVSCWYFVLFTGLGFLGYCVGMGDLGVPFFFPLLQH